MDQVGGIIWDITKCFCVCAKNEAAYIYDLEEIFQSLEEKWKDLQSTKRDLKDRVDKAEDTGRMRRAKEIDRWLEKVDGIQREITDIQAKRDKEIEDKCLSKCCPKNCTSSYKLGKKATKLLENVNQLEAEGKRYNENFRIAHNIPPEPMEMPQDETVGLDLMFDKVWNCIQVENVGVIGLYGMGGVGKTTLLKKIYNELVKRKLGFDFVLWVVVSKEPNLDSIMDNIRKLVGIRDGIWNNCSNQDEKAANIYRLLKLKKFVLLLDDIWESLDLKSVGVPRPKDTNFQSKLLFTTRLQNVCAKMQAQMKFIVQILTEKEAIDLFFLKVGKETLSSHPNIPKLAKEMAMECKGLPLALIVVGSAMAGVKSVEAWKYSIKNLTSSSWTAPDLETKVFSILKFSYDKLDEVQKRCFLYCAMYPEDFEILVSDIIDKWMWEKFLGEHMSKSVQDMRDHGELVVEKLKLSCLLESVEDGLFRNRTVKMHDMIRDMALWLSKQDDESMELVKRILIMNEYNFHRNVLSFKEESKKIVDDHPNVTTFVLLKDIFFVHSQHQLLEDIRCMERLKALELHVDLIAFEDIIVGLISLEYLSYHTNGRIGAKFWIDLQSLKNLKFLSFQRMNASADTVEWNIPLGVLSSLRQLRVFRLIGIKILSEERRILEDLESLPNIEELWINIESGEGLNKLLESTKLHILLYNVYISISCLNENMPLVSLASISRMKQLQQIHFIGLKIRSEQSSFVSGTCCLTKLRRVLISKCAVIHVTWLKYAPLLQELYIYGCESMEEVIKEEEEAINDENVDSSVFSCLVTLKLYELPRLKNIHKTPLPFPSLKSICIENCPNLMRKLPFDSNSAEQNKLHIHVYGNWWNNLEWDDSSAKDRFKLKFSHIHWEEQINPFLFEMKKR